MTTKLKIIRNCSISDILECDRVALIYSPKLLLKDKIDEYIPSSFGERNYLFANKVIQNEIENQREYFIDLNTVDQITRSNFKFNYILLLDNRNKVIAFVRLNSSINTGELSTDTISIVFTIIIEVDTIYIDLDLKELSQEFDLHDDNLIDKSATIKSDLTDLSKSLYKPYTSNILHLVDNPDYIMKYSGSIIKDQSFVNPFIFDLNNLDHESILKILIDSVPYLVVLGSDCVLLYDYDCSNVKYTIPLNGNTYIDISKDYLITSVDDYLVITRLVNYIPSDSVNLISSMRYVIDSMTGETYFYKIGTSHRTYGITTGFNDSNEIGSEIYCSSKLQSILEELANHKSNYGIPLIVNLPNYELLQIADGLAIYKSTNSNNYVFQSYFHVGNANKLYYELELDADSISILNNRCIICRKSNKYFLYKLVNNNDKFNWKYIDLGVTGCMYNIYLLAKQKYSNTSTIITDLVYKGNVFGLINNTSLVSL